MTTTKHRGPAKKTPQEAPQTDDQLITFLMPPEAGDIIRGRAEKEEITVDSWMVRKLCEIMGIEAPAPEAATTARGRPPTGTTRASGMRLMRFEASPAVVSAIDEGAAKEGRERGDWLRRVLCLAVGVQPPVPGKRGPKPKA